MAIEAQPRTARPPVAFIAAAFLFALVPVLFTSFPELQKVNLSTRVLIIVVWAMLAIVVTIRQARRDGSTKTLDAREEDAEQLAVDSQKAGLSPLKTLYLTLETAARNAAGIMALAYFSMKDAEPYRLSPSPEFSWDDAELNALVQESISKRELNVSNNFAAMPVLDNAGTMVGVIAAQLDSAAKPDASAVAKHLLAAALAVSEVLQRRPLSSDA